MAAIAPYEVRIRLEDFAQFTTLIEACADLVAAAEDDYPRECLAVREAIDSYREGLS